MSDLYGYYETRELRHRRRQALARFGFYLLTAVSAGVAVLALKPF